jgi:ABC-type transport system substrate-binding protein
MRPHLMIGVRLSNRYEIAREVGRGGMGVVYAARDPLLERDVAVKILTPTSLSSAAEARFRSEARIVAGMDHPGIVPVYDIGEHEGAMFLVLPLVRGANLRRHIQERLLSDADVIEIGAQVAEALDYSHARGVIHRDVKPENIILAREAGELLRVRLTDFGLAIVASQQRHTQSGSIVGSALYLSPEQVGRDSETDRRSDVYALGTVLFECFSGRLPFDAGFPAILYAIRNEAPAELSALRPDLDASISAIVMSCLAKDPAQRPQQASEVATALRAMQPGGNAREARLASDRRSFSEPNAIQEVRTVGRDEPLRLLRERLDRAAAGDAQLVLIGGQSGVGKSRLLEELRREAQRRNVLVLSGRFYDQDRGFPFQAFCEAIQEYFGRSTAGRSGVNFRDLADDLVSLFPILGEMESVRSQLPTADRPPERSATGSGDRAHVFEQLGRTFIRISAGQPLMLVLEELQAADISIEALHFLFRRLKGCPVLLLATYRSEDVGKAHALATLIRNLRGDPSFTPVEIEPLRADHSRELVEELLRSREVDPAVFEKIWSRAEGNPLFTSELVKAMVESKTLFRDSAGTWQLSKRTDSQWEELPATIQETIERRIQRLPDATRKLLSVAAVIGRRFDLADLEPLLDDEIDVDAILQPLLDSGLIREPRDARGDVYRFASGAVHEALYASIPRRRRRTLHLRHAGNLEKRHGSRTDRIEPDLLHHYANADVREKVFHHGLRLASRFLENYSAEDAIRVSRIVLDFADEEIPDECVIAGEAHRVIAAGHRLLGNTDAALNSAAEAYLLLERCGDGSGACRAARLAAETAWERRRFDDARRWAEKGITAGRRGSEPGDLRKLLLLAATIANIKGEHSSAQLRLAEADALEPAAAQTETSGSGPVPGVIHLALAGDIQTLDPSLAFTMAQDEVLPAIFDTLTRATDAARIEPWLAESFRASEDGLRYDFRLRSGIRFHDERAVTSHDVRHSFERLLLNERSESRAILATVKGASRLLAGEPVPLEGFEVISENEFAILLDIPVAFFPALLTNIATAIVPAHANRFTGNWREGSAGTGPFRVVRFEPGRRVELEANPFYWRPGLPKCEKLVFVLGVAPEESRDGFLRGRYSIVWDLYPAHVESLRLERQFASNYREVPRLSTYYVALNANRGPLSSLEMRRDVLRGIDVDRIVARHVGREAIRANGFIPPGLIGHEAESADPAFDETSRINVAPVEQLTAMLNSSYRGQYAGVAQELFSMLETHGYPVRVIESRSEYFANQATALASADLVLTRWIADYPDPDDFASLLHTQRGLLGQLCGNPTLDLLIERGRVEPSPSLRHEIYREIEGIVRDQALLQPLFYEQAYRFARPDIEGLEMNFTSPVVSYEKLAVKM